MKTLRNLVETLPACREVVDWPNQTLCGVPATHGYGSGYRCDGHARGQTPLPWAGALREAMKVLSLVETLTFPHPRAVVDARDWLHGGAPSASRSHDSHGAVHTLLSVVKLLPILISRYNWGTPEWRAAMEDSP